jgi:hypothetical protein
MSICNYDNHPYLQPMARFGVSIMKENRPTVMTVVILLNLISFVLLCFAMAGSTTHAQQLQTTAWTLGSTDGVVVVWLGLQSISGQGFIYEWDSSACTAKVCDKCSMAGENTMNATVLTFICCIALVNISILRSRKDSITLKAASCLLCLVSFFCLVIGMGSWANQCIDNLSSGYDYSLGVGFQCVIASLAIIIFSLALHLLIPVDAPITEEPTFEPTFEPISEPTYEPTTEPAFEPYTKSTTEPAVNPEEGSVMEA